jgi:hypothetical protein
MIVDVALLAVLLIGLAVGPLVAAVGRGFQGLNVVLHLAVMADSEGLGPGLLHGQQRSSAT